MKYISKLALVMLLAFAACKKTETVSPSSAPVDDTVFTRDKMIGEWVVTEVKIDAFKDGLFSFEQDWQRPKGYFQDYKLIEKWSDKMESYITIAADGTYRHTKANGELNSYMLDDVWPAEGKWAFEGDTVRITCTTLSGVRDAGWIYNYLNGAVSFALQDSGRDTVFHADATYQTFVVLIKKDLIDKTK